MQIPALREGKRGLGQPAQGIAFGVSHPQKEKETLTPLFLSGIFLSLSDPSSAVLGHKRFTLQQTPVPYPEGLLTLENTGIKKIHKQLQRFPQMHSF